MPAKDAWQAGFCSSNVSPPVHGDVAPDDITRVVAHRTGLALTARAAANSPKVSIVSTTYNQEDYVRQAFDSFVAQETDFPMEIIVADDASTDATPLIIQEYASRYPHLFRPILRSENLGLNANLTGAMSAARGEYLALCEGDDYWIDPQKLSKQVAFLDRHPGTVLCFHPVRMVWKDGHAKDSRFPPIRMRGNLSVETLILKNFIQTNSVVYRRLPRYDDIPSDIMPLDWYLHVRHAVHGDIAMLPETMAVYRRHPQGMWHNRVVDPPKFWLAHGRGHAALYDAMLDLFSGDPGREELVAVAAGLFLREIAKVSGPEGRAMLQDTIAQHPRFAMLALQHHWATPTRRLKTMWSGLVASMPSRRALPNVYPAGFKRQPGMSENAGQPRGNGR